MRQNARKHGKKGGPRRGRSELGWLTEASFRAENGMTLKRKNPGSFAEKMAQSVIPIRAAEIGVHGRIGNPSYLVNNPGE